MHCYPRVVSLAATFATLAFLSSSGQAWQSSWQETSPFPSITYIWTYVGPGRYYDPVLYMRQGQERLFFYSQATAMTAFQYRYPGGSWQSLSIQYVEPGAQYYGYTHFPAIAPPWSAVGQYSIEIRWLDLAGYWNYHSYVVHVVPPAQRMFADNAGNKMILWQGGSNSINMPALVVEGFDPQNANSPELYYQIGSDFFGQLRNYDRDIMILDFGDGGTSISNNAQYVRSALSYINSIKSGSEKIILAGLSMGGVVCRYALAEAEAMSQNHNVSLFFSIDAPQQDAVIDNGFQDYINQNDEGTPNPSLNSPAAKQMLRYSTYDPLGTTHANFYSQLNQLNGDGYPNLCRNVGVSFSPNTENPNSGQWLKVTLVWEGLNPIVTITDEIATFDINSGDPWKEAGSYLPRSTTMQWGGVQYTLPFSTDSNPMFFFNIQAPIPFLFYEVTREKNPTFIPHKSALDIVNGSSRFDTTYFSSTPRYHDEFPSELITPLINEVLGPPVPLSVTMSGPNTVWHADPKGTPPNLYTWTANTSGGVPPLNYVWKRNGSQVGTASSYQEYFGWNGYSGGSYQFTLRVDVTDAQSSNVFAAKTVTAYNSGGGIAPKMADFGGLTLALPDDFSLNQNHPNPFNPETEISFGLPEPSSVRITILDVLGREIKTLADREYAAGYQRVTWNGTDASGNKVGSGVYFYRIIATGQSGKQFTKVMKMALTK